MSPDVTDVATRSRVRTGPPTPTASPRRGRRGRGRGTVDLLYLAPALVLVLGIVYFCIGYTGWVSAYDWDGVSPDPTPVGSDNYTRALQNSVFVSTLEHTLLFVIPIVIELVLGLIIAALLHSRIIGAPIYKVALFIPVVIAPASIAPVFRQIFAAEGTFNSLLSTVGLGSLRHPWLADPSTALPTLMAVNVWQWTGFAVVLYYAAMTQIDASTLEAARMDGAGNLRMLWHIVTPNLRSTTISLSIIAFLAALKSFDLPYLVTAGGPNNATQFPSTYIYQQGITNFHVGFAGALSIIVLAIALAFAVLQTRRYVRAAS